jgi:hypothetical protein
MDYDEMLEVWRAQDETPPYRVNPDLLQIVVQQEHAGLRRGLGWELWAIPWALWMVAIAMQAIAFALLFAATRGWTTTNVWDYVAMGIGLGVVVVWPVAYWMSHKRQPPRERGFGNSLQEEIRRNLSRVDYQLSWYGRLGPSLLMSAPLWVAVILFFWASLRMTDKPFSWLPFFIIAWVFLLPMGGTSRHLKKQLLTRRRRLSQLLELLNASEWKESKWELDE